MGKCVSLSIFLLLLGILIPFSLAALDSSAANYTLREKSSRFFSLFNRVIFKQEECQGTDNFSGVCLSSEECKNSGGSKVGNCAAGFGTCCLIVTTGCGGTINKNNTYIQNPEFPATTSKTETCVWDLAQESRNICFTRLDFVVLEVAKPVLPATGVNVANGNNGDCPSDVVKFTQGNGMFVSDICGLNNGLHMYLNAGPEESYLPTTMSIAIAGSTDIQRRWNVKVAQIPCSTSYTPWQGCTQYFHTTSGTFKSYNYDGESHLNLQEYTICIRRNKGMCQIIYRAADTEKSFKISNIETHTLATNGRTNCQTDWSQVLLAVGGVNTCNVDVNNDPRFTANILAIATKLGTRFCGSSLGCTHQVSSQRGAITQVMSPFEFGFHSDKKETANERENFGFHIDFLQVPCA